MLADKRMEKVNQIRFKASTKPPTIEFDQKVRAWYLRFRDAKVAKTISEDKPGYISVIDLDSQNRVIGLELIGVREFTIMWAKKVEPLLSKVDFDRAVFVPARDSAEA